MLEKIILEHCSDFNEILRKLGYYQIRVHDDLLIYEHDKNQSKIIIKEVDNDIKINFENRLDENFLKSDWYLGNKDGICIDDIFTLMAKPEFKKFCEVKLAYEQTQPKGFENVRIHKGTDTELTDTQNKIKNLCDKISEILIYKNKMYGNSILEPKQIFFKGGYMENILMRLDDKIGRIANTGKGNSIRTNDIVDIIGYLILLLIAKNVGYSELEKLKD